MVPYKQHFACFDCRKTFKRRRSDDLAGFDHNKETDAKCPECGKLMANMGLDFEAPKKDDIKAWRHIRRLYSVGITYHSCGCTGPGYIPNDKEALIQYFEGIKRNYESQLDFWRSRVEPANSRELQREESKHWTQITSIPRELRAKKQPVKSSDAINYWIGRIREIEIEINKSKV